MSSEQFVGDVWIAQLDRKRFPQARRGPPLQKFYRRSVRGTTQVGTSADRRERRVLSDTRQQSSAK